VAARADRSSRHSGYRDHEARIAVALDPRRSIPRFAGRPNPLSEDSRLVGQLCSGDRTDRPVPADVVADSSGEPTGDLQNVTALTPAGESMRRLLRRCHFALAFADDGSMARRAPS